MDNDTLLALALAIQQAATALVNLLQQAQPPGCDHRNRQDLSTFGGGTHWVCQDCGYEFEEAAHAENQEAGAEAGALPGQERPDLSRPQR